MDNYNNEESKKPTLNIDPTVLRVIAVAIILIFIVIIISLVINYRNANNALTYNELDSSAFNDEPNIKYDNLTYLRKMVGGTLPSDFYVVIPKIVFNNSGNSDSSEGYSVKVDNSSLTTSVYFPYNICSFVLSVSDGRKYQISLASNEQNMGGLLAIPLSSDEENAVLYYLNTDSSEKFDDDAATVRKWAKTIYDGELMVVSNLD